MANVECTRVYGIDAYPSLCTAIATRSSIKHLAIATLGDKTYQMLCDIRSPLDTLRLTSQTLFTHITEITLLVDLAHFSETPRSFEIAYTWINASESPPSSGSFSAMRSLVLSDNERVAGTVMPLRTGMHCFPHLQRLSAYFGHGYTPYSRAHFRAEN
ncbi:hypothetical protein TRAPUB_3547 [Trametes pubescens]|uniref:Uncharacterized protein n=1 Tax=Trametes pubescens TaxID=154538 RepID=A0A1M2VDG8_TRAPU|nr:hypothetical protein TRAPUB_3547 [Trametes pubescens]